MSGDGMTDKIVIVCAGAALTVLGSLALGMLWLILARLGSIDERLAAFLKFQGVTETTMLAHSGRIAKLEERTERCPVLNAGSAARQKCAAREET